MRNDIEAAFSRRQKPLLMTHVVAGYPDLDRSRETVGVMVENGAGLVEIQIPFTDPLADGPTITAATRDTLKNGVRPKDCLAMVRQLKKRISTPILVMTYGNISYRMGLERFAAACAEAGAAGAIIPDLAFDEVAEDLPGLFRRRGLAWIPVLSPGMGKERIRRVLNAASGFAYITLRVGITGAKSRLARTGVEFIDIVRGVTNLPLAAGFGVSRPEHVRLLRNKVDAVVIGSRLLHLYNIGGLKGVASFLRLCRRELDSSG